MEQPVNFIRTQAEPLTVKYTIRVDRDIEDPSLFQEELATIRQSKEGDVVHLLINSGGGRIDTAKAFLNSIAQSQAHIITEIEGEACSAATLIFLSGDEYRVSDDASFMIHSASYGYYGKENNVRQYVEHQAKAVERLLTKYYRHFLTEAEIVEVINGRDMWMDADEIMERLEKRMELFQEEESEFMKQFEEDESLYSKEDFEDKSKEEILAMLFGEENPPELDKKVVEEGCRLYSDENSFVNSLRIYKDGSVVDDDGVVFDGEDVEKFEGVYADPSYFKSIADLLDIKYAHNISMEKLQKRLNEKVKEIVDSLNK